jgi:glycosyltransferase involved in cell wall biosynthesis
VGWGVPLKILFIVPYAPTRIRTRPFHLIRALAGLGHQITVATVWHGEDDRAAIRELEQSSVSVLAQRLPLTRSLWSCCRALPTREPLQAHYNWSPELARRLKRLLKASTFDVVHVEHLRGVRYGLALAREADASARRTAMVWDSVDCISTLFRRAACESLNLRTRLAARLELRRTERYEGLVVGRFDRVLVTSQTDRKDLLDLARREPNGRECPCVDVLPNGVDLEYFSPVPQQPREADTLVVTGKMSYHANATAVVRFVREVMPAVWAELPTTRLWVVGSNPGRELAELGKPRGDSRVWVTGTVPDIRPFLCKATLSVAPIQYGVGIQNKVLEALACGTPTVATCTAVSALDARPDEELAVARSMRELAGVIVTLLKNPARRERLGRAGRRFVQQRHDWHALAGQLEGIYRHAIV